ncbi:MAG: hypothetical protein K9N51_13825, partial [Candidatus Pacebacteria bacterium]|nr:hypothetical protein [Candidatus Paceibacterota bacterium]
TFDSKARRLDDQWTSYDNQARPLPMSKVELRRRIRLVKSFGFRCALYFADSLAYDDASPDFNPAWTWRAPSGQPAHWYYWQKRPDSTGLKNYRLDPANPEVRQWFLDYARSLIAEYGRDLDALVWDETFTENPVGPEGQRKLGSVMTGVDSAMMSLVASLTQEVQKAWLTWPDLAFLTSDNIRDRNRHVPFALVSHGTYQDSACEPGAWDFGRLPNFRNAMISCNWYPIGNRDYNRLAVETYDRPQGVSNGYGDERGPAEMPPDILDEIVQRFLVQVDGL